MELETSAFLNFLGFISYSQQLLTLFCFCWSGDILEEAKCKVVQKLSSLENSVENTNLLIALENSLNFKIFNLFEINLKLLFLIFSISVSYVIVLMQFELKM